MVKIHPEPFSSMFPDMYHLVMSGGLMGRIREHSLVTEKTLVPGDPGTRKWMERYGEHLICIRYKYDRNTTMKIKTVELAAEEKPCKPKTRIPWDKTVKVRIRYGEINLASLVKHAGGKWNAQEKVWEAPY